MAAVPPDRHLKLKTLETFANHEGLRVSDYAQLVHFRASSNPWSYLHHMHRFGLLYRGRDWRGRLFYRLAPKGAQWLLWWNRTYGRGAA